MKLSAVSLSRDLQAGKISSVELMQWTLKRISEKNPGHNALVSLADEESLLATATQADTDRARGKVRGWLHGMPYAVKDLANLKGFVTSFGSPLYRHNQAGADDIFVSRVRAAGALFIGKTNVPEFGLGSQTYNRVFGPTTNAFDQNLTAGGSSGGAAVALATGMLPVADGSDMMGSLRNPAAFNGVVGFRPGLGRVPAKRDDVFFHQLGTDGPMGRTVQDVIRLFMTMAGQHKAAPLSYQPALPDPDEISPLDLKGVKIGWLGDYNGYLPFESGVTDLCEASLDRLVEQGAKIEPVKMDFSLPELWQAWLTLRQWQVAAGRRAESGDPDRHREFKPEMVWELEQSRTVSAEQVAMASQTRSQWYQATVALYDHFDFLALPSAQVFPFPVTTPWVTEIAGHTMDTYHRWMEVVIGPSMSGCPVISLPCLVDENAGRAGIQFQAPMGDDARLLSFALAYEQSIAWHSLYDWT